MKFLLFSSLLILINFYSISQDFREIFYQNSWFEQNDTTRFRFQADNINFLKNNEYFTPLFEGYTLIGYTINPVFQYRINNKIKLNAGAYALKYSGLDMYSIVLPYYSVLADFNKLKIIFGGLDQNHYLIEPVHSFENRLTQKPESGFQIKYNNTYYSLDTWVDWQNFIFYNDSTQEKLQFGWCNSIKTTISNNTFQIPFNILIKHKGGQIDTSNLPIQTLGVFYSGLYFKNQWIKDNFYIDHFSVYGLIYKDMSPNPSMKYINGNAVYSEIYSIINNFHFQLVWWTGSKFYSPAGNQMFLSMSHYDNAKCDRTRNIIYYTTSFNKYISNGIQLKVIGELYYDKENARIDYSYGCKFIVKIDEKIK